MPFKLTLPFRTIKMQLYSEGFLNMPLMESDAVRLNSSTHMLAGKYAEAFQDKVVNKGNFVFTLDELQKGGFVKDTISVQFPAAKDKIRYPAFDIEFDFFYNKNERGLWASLPALGVEAFAGNFEKLKEKLVETVRLEFSQQQRLKAVQKIVSAIWFKQMEMETNEMLLAYPSLTELEEASDQKQNPLLPQAAQLLKIRNRQVFGRAQELQQLERILRSDFNKNVLLVAPAGAGKTALVWEIARQTSFRIWETTASKLIKELTLDTGWQDNLSYLCKELGAENDLLFVRNLAELFEVGQYSGNSVSMAEYLRTFIARGSVNLISECTPEELANIELKSPNYISMFQVIRLEEPDGKKLEDIIVKKVNSLAKNRSISFEEDAVQEVIRLNRRFTPYAGFPGKPIRFLESIMINQPKDQKVNLLKKSDIIHHFCEETGMPRFMVDPAIPMDAQAIKNNFNNEVYGQENAVNAVVDLMAAVKTALTPSGKPIASFLFVGPTGVGKTELAKVLAKFMFGSRDRMIRFDMSEFANPVSVLRLTGSGSQSDGLLTSAVRREPFCVLLFDEIEKAHGTFNDLLLQLLSEGRLTDSRGKLVNFCSTIIIMTSNIGASRMGGNRISLQQSESNEDINAYFKSAVQKFFRPELFNRMDQIIAFNPLSKDVVRFVVEREIDLFRKREGIRYRDMDLNISEATLDYLAIMGYDQKYGARHLQRSIRELLIIPLARKLNREDFEDRLMVSVDLQDHKINIEVEADPLGMDLMFEKITTDSLADSISEARREIYRLREGSFYIQMMRHLEALEGQKNRLKAKFWEDLKKGKKYSNLLATKGNFEKLIAKIESLEMEVSLSVMDLKPTLADGDEQLKAWKKAYFNFQKEIYTRRYPKSSFTHFSVYGQRLAPILKFYKTLFEQKNFKYTAHSVWYRASYFHEIIEKAELSVDEQGELDAAEHQAARQEYIKLAHDFDKKKQAILPEEGDVLIGMEFVVVGDCAHPYLEIEAGIQLWKLEDNSEQLYRVVVNNHHLPTDTTAHTKNYFPRRGLRRTFTPDTIKDIQLKINREAKPAARLELILAALDRLFEMHIQEQVS